MKRKTLFISLLVLMAAAALAAAQQPQALLEYYENSSGDLKVVTAEGKELSADALSLGQEIPVGSTVVTYEGDFAEILLKPNGTILRVSENTNFRVEGLQGRAGEPQNTFSVAVGKFRAVVAKGDKARYSFKSNTAVCGVRGTDFGLVVLPTQSEIAFVVDGVIDFTNAAGRTIQVTAGMMADALAPAFQATAASPAAMAGYLKGLDFKKLLKSSVQGYEAGQAPAQAEQAQAAAEAAKETFVSKLMYLLGMEIGSVTIEEQTYAKAIIQPRFAFGKWKMALYLPVIYKSNMLDPQDWYSPRGNDNEWSFGADQHDWVDVGKDFVADLFLKIRYLQYGEQRDPFFFKLGNLNNITIGHGTIMRNYANDSDFPAVREVGLNLGVDREKFGFEAMVNDAAAAQIFGGRFYYRPLAPGFPLALGLTALTDIDPDKEEAYGRPILLNAGLDVDFPLIETERLKMILFTDVGAMAPYFREEVPAYAISSGFASEAIWDGSKPKNWGLAAGILGNILPLQYRLEFRWSDGTFRPAFYNSMYERNRQQYAKDIVSYLAYPDDPDYDNQTMGIYGEAGYTLEKVFFFEAGYLWPWYLKATGEMPDDYLLLRFGILKGLFPLYGSIGYERTRFMPTLLGEGGLDLFDARTVLSAMVVYPVAAMLDLAVTVATNVIEETPGSFKSFPTVSITLRANY